MTRLLSLLLATILFLGAGSAAGQDAETPTWIPFEEALAAGKESGKMVLVDIWSPNCGWCRRMQNEVYPRPDLLEYLNEHFITGRLNIDVRDDSLSYLGYTLSSAELAVGFGAKGTPTTIFLSSDGQYITRLPGFHDYESYLPVLHFIGSDSFRDMSFQEFQAREGIKPVGSGDQ
jgi:thioredoxin-related protein